MRKKKTLEKLYRLKGITYGTKNNEDLDKIIDWVKEAQAPSFLNRVFKKARIVVTWAGNVDITYSKDGMYHERIRIGEHDFLHGIWSVLERLNGKNVGISIEELRD